MLDMRAYPQPMYWKITSDSRRDNRREEFDLTLRGVCDREYGLKEKRPALALGICRVDDDTHTALWILVHGHEQPEMRGAVKEEKTPS